MCIQLKPVIFKANLYKSLDHYFIVHRLSTITNSNTILIMKEGQIIENRHQKLIQKNLSIK